MITRIEASRIAAQKAIELFGRERLNALGGCWGMNGDIFHLGIGESYDEGDDVFNRTTPPSIDETKPWKSYTDIFVSTKTGEVTVRQRDNVTIFDGENAKYLKK